MYNFLEKLIQGQDLNTKYFIQREEDYKASPLLIYTSAQRAKNFFSDIVRSYEDNNPYIIQKVAQVNDEAAIRKLKAPYYEKLEVVEQKWNEYKQSHLDEFNEVLAINVGNEEEKFSLSRFNVDRKFSLEEAVQGMWCASEILKRFGKDTEEYEALPKYISYRSKDEFKEKHANIKNRFRKELNIPAEEDFIVKVEKTSISIKPGRHPAPTNDEPLEYFFDEFVDYIKDNNI